MTGVPKSKYFQPLSSRNFPINVCLFVAETLVYKYITLFGRVPNGCSHNFKFTETCSNFLYYTLARSLNKNKTNKFLFPAILGNTFTQTTQILMAEGVINWLETAGWKYWTIPKYILLTIITISSLC